MQKGYAPASAFLRELIGDGQRAVSESDIVQLVALMLDADEANRDWATFLLAQLEFDTPAIREALRHATNDESNNVRAEAVWGLARRDPQLALPFVQEGLRAQSVQIPMLEAAELCAHPSLIEDLRVWAEPSEASYLEEVAADALAACEEAAEAS